MAYVTRSQAEKAAIRRGGYSLQLSEARLRKEAAAPMTASFDVFLSHAAEDASVILGVMQMLEDDGLSVYVDWAVDPQLDRRLVTTATAARLRGRMKRCGYLIYASSRTSSSSKWMPWELGFFDGYRPQRVGILPIVDSPYDSFLGQEYLGLYPRVELKAFTSGRTRFAAASNGSTVSSIQALARSAP